MVAAVLRKIFDAAGWDGPPARAGLSVAFKVDPKFAQLTPTEATP